MNATATNIETPVPPSTASTTEPSPRWSMAQRIVFRFVFVHFALFFFPAPLTSLVPVVGDITEDFISASIWFPIVRVVSKYVLRMPGEVTNVMTGSGDRTFDYVVLFTSLCLATVVTAIWSFVQRHKNNHEVLEAVFRIWLRYTLAAIMIRYGAVKVVKLQFSTPSPFQLIATYGDSSPMNLLWTFMGFSTPYTFFAGLMEIAPAFLLFFRRTTLLGALLLMGVMGNIVMLNFCYDVPVKIYSTHLFVMAALIASPDVKRLWQFFLKNAPTEKAPERKRFEKKSLELARVIGKTLVIASFLLGRSHVVWTRAHQYGPLAHVSSQDGAYEVVSFVREEKEVPPLPTDGTRPRYFGIRGFGDIHFASFVMANGDKKRFEAVIDTGKKTISLKERPKGDDKPSLLTLHYAETTTGFETFEGTYDGVPVRFALRKVDANKFLLMNRGFHWVSEVPYNR